MIGKTDRTIYIKCTCGCSVMTLHYAFGGVYFNVYGEKFYSSQIKISDIISDKFKNLKSAIKKEKVYNADVIIEKKDFDEFVEILEPFLEGIEEIDKKEYHDEYEKSDMGSHFCIQRISSDLYSLSLITKYSIKDVLLNKTHRTYDTFLSLPDFKKFVSNVKKYYKNTTEVINND